MADKSYIIGEFLAVAQKTEQAVHGEKFSHDLFKQTNINQFATLPQANMERLEQHLMQFHSKLKEQGEENLIHEADRLYALVDPKTLNNFFLNRGEMMRGYHDYLAEQPEV